LRRLGGIAHRVEDLIGRLRDGEIQPSPSVVDLCLESVDVLKKTLHREWADEAEMRGGVDSLLGTDCRTGTAGDRGRWHRWRRLQRYRKRLRLFKLEAERPRQRRRLPQNKLQRTSRLRIALGRLDRMMNTVGELVISRTKMVGRVVTELEKLIDTLGFSKERLQGKVNEFQEKYEFNRIRSQLATPWASSQTKKTPDQCCRWRGSYLEEFSETGDGSLRRFQYSFAFDDGNFGGRE